MIIKITNFGDILISRPAGREAFMLAKAYVLKGIQPNDDIILDFNEVKVLAPSWADEFVSGIRSEYANTVEYTNTENPSVKASLKAIVPE